MGQLPGLAKITGLILGTKPEILINSDFAKDIFKPTKKKISNTKDINI
jgi:hypothetical protein